MAKNDEITSTERLLNLIRKKEQPASTDKRSAVKTKFRSTGNLIAKLSPTKNVTIGIEIGHAELKLAKIIHLPDGTYELLDFAERPFAPDSTPTSNGFIYFLKDALNNFCGIGNKNTLWSVISSVNVETRCLRIPKLPKKQIPNAVYWVFTKEVPFKKDQEVLDFKILGDITEDGVAKMEVMTYTAPQKEIFDLRDMFSEAGYPLAGISIVPFAVQNLLGTILTQTNEKDVCNLFIGKDWSRIAIYSCGKLILSRGIKSGMHSMVLCISEAIKTKSFKSAQLSLEAYKNIHAHQSTCDEDSDLSLAQKIFFSFIRGSLPVSRNKKYNILSEDQILTIIEPALERLIRQIERTFEHYAQHFRKEGLVRIMLSGPLTANEMVVKYLGRQLDLPVAVMDPFPIKSKFTAKVTVPESDAKRESFMPAIGMGLSTNAITPNFLFTYSDREKVRLLERITQAALALCLLCLIVLSGIYWQQKKIVTTKAAHLKMLSKELDRNSPEADRDLILKLYSQSQQRHDRFRSASRRFAIVAFLEEISRITPTNIRLISCEVLRTEGSSADFNLSLEGIIFGNRAGFESSLASFMLRLKGSPLFSRPAVMNKRFQFYDNQEVLRFSAKLEAA